MQSYINTIISYIIRPAKRKLIRYAYKLRSKKGIEIGGPSNFFSLRSYFPVFMFAKQIDGVNYSNETVWEGKLKEGTNYNYFKNKTGYQYICEATNLNVISNNAYDFALSCHSLEHIANPLKAVKEWARVIKPGGLLILVLPDKDFTFDHNRPITTFQHLLEDYKNDTSENDSTHFEEVIKLHDLKKDLGVKSYNELLQRTNDNYTNRCVHHHVFNINLLKEIVTYTDFNVVCTQKAAPFNLVLIAKKK